MGDPAELTSAELDRIEDALERLGDLDGDLVDMSPAARERLAAYRAILQVSRDALPMQDVPAGVLEGVLAHAREVAEAPALEPPLSPPRASWWDRWRTTLLVPGIAVAATAALILVVVGPMGASESPDASADARLARAEVSVEQAAHEEDASPEPTASAPGALPGAAGEAFERSLEGAAAAEDPAFGEPAPEAEESANDKLATDDATAGPRWDIVARGDRARRDGDCKRASAEYAMALTDDDAHVRARAYAGLGLCDAIQGRYKEASDRYQRAKELDPEMETFIEEQRPRGSRGGGGAATKAKRAAPRATSSKASAKPRPKAQAVEQAFE